MMQLAHRVRQFNHCFAVRGLTISINEPVHLIDREALEVIGLGFRFSLRIDAAVVQKGVIIGVA